LIKKLNKIFNQISRREEKRREEKKKKKKKNFFDVVNSETSENSDVSLFKTSEFSDVANSATSEKFFFFFAKN
jgi:hypothetical protein